MSHPLLSADVLFYQRFLATLGLYAGRLDGDWGPRTDRADRAFLDRSDAIARNEGALDGRSEAQVRTLHPTLQTLCRRALRLLATQGVDARVLSGTRTYAQQDALYRQGRFGNPGSIVTRARGGQSNHNFCIAFDIGLFQAGRYIAQEVQPYIDAAALIKTHVPGLAWGGDWQRMKDRPHWELPTGLPIAEVRSRFERGEPYVS